MKKLFFRKNGFIIEFLKLEKLFFLYLFKKISSFLIDMSLFVILQIFAYFVLKINIFLSTFLIFSIFLLSNLTFAFLFKNKTLGLFVARLSIVDFDAKKISRNKLIIRIMIYSLYSIPFIGWFLALVSFISMFFTRGITIVDILSKTQIISKEFEKYINNVYENIK